MPKERAVSSRTNKLAVAEQIKRLIESSCLQLAITGSSKAFAELIAAKLGSQYKVKSLGGSNNPVASITHVNSNFSYVVRTITTFSKFQQSGELSPRGQAKQKLSQSPRFEKNYFEIEAKKTEFADGNITRIMFECSSYYANGDLADYFKKVNATRSIEKKMQLLRFYSRNLLFLVSNLKSNGIWHTDIKPNNILLDDNMNLVLSDTKGILSTKDLLVPANQIERSPAYCDNRIYVGRHIHLLKLMQLNLAVSIFQIVTGELPPHNSEGLLSFDFSNPLFNNNEGKRLKQLITALNSDGEFNYKSWLKKLAKPLWVESQCSYVKSHGLFHLSGHRAITQASVEEQTKAARKMLAEHRVSHLSDADCSRPPRTM